MTIRISLTPEDQFYDGRFYLPGFQQALADLGIVLRPDLANPDITLVGYQKFLASPAEYMSRPGKLALHGTYDFGLVPEIYREYLDDDKILCVIQGQRYKTLALQNAALAERHYHGTLIDPTAAQVPMPPMTQKGFDKIQIWGGFAVMAALSPYFQDIPSPSRDIRPLRLHAIMNTFYASPLLTQHREQALAAVRAFGEQDYSSFVYGRSSGTVRSVFTDSYSLLMQQSQCVLSPWGWGEYCIRDFEAILAGAVVIKPRTDWSETWPPLVPDAAYVACRPDFSDLPQRLADGAERFHDLAWRRDLYYCMRAAGNFVLLAKRFRSCLPI